MQLSICCNTPRLVGSPLKDPLTTEAAGGEILLRVPYQGAWIYIKLPFPALEITNFVSYLIHVSQDVPPQKATTYQTWHFEPFLKD
jgi:hypothetical protein